jgi:hypothetical protein
MIARGFLKDLALDPAYLRDWLAEIANRFLWTVLWVGAGYLAIAALFGALTLIRRKKLKEREQRHRHAPHTDPEKEGVIL